MTTTQRAALEEAIASYAHARMGIKSQHTAISKMRSQLKLEAAQAQLKLLLDSMMYPIIQPETQNETHRSSSNDAHERNGVYLSGPD